MARVKGNPDKRRLLRQSVTLNPNSLNVSHPLFQDNDFFDPDDLIQVKYEMLRQVRVDRQPVSQTAREFGFSRPSFYQAQFTFEQGGVAGLLPHKRGPKSGHKLTARIMQFVAERRVAQPELSFAQLAQLVNQNFWSTSASPQHQTATAAGKKTMMQTSQPIAALADREALIAAYEELRRRFLSRQQGPGLTLFMRRGMREWINAYSLFVGSPPAPVPTTPNDHAFLPDGVLAEVVLILAGMLLHECHEARR